MTLSVFEWIYGRLIIANLYMWLFFCNSWFVLAGFLKKRAAH